MQLNSLVNSQKKLKIHCVCPVATAILTVMNVAPYKRNWTGKAFLELQSHSSALLNFNAQWKELQDHFNELQKLIKKRFEELARKTKEDEKEKKSAIEKITVNPDKTSEKNCALENRTGNTSKIPEKKFTTEKSTRSHNKTSEKSSTAKISTGNPKKSPENNSIVEKSIGNPSKAFPALKDDVNSLPQLKSLCEKMDGEGIWKFLVNSSSEFMTIHNEAPTALRCVADPTRLVLPWRTFIRTAMAGEII